MLTELFVNTFGHYWKRMTAELSQDDTFAYLQVWTVKSLKCKGNKKGFHHKYNILNSYIYWAQE